MTSVIDYFRNFSEEEKKFIEESENLKYMNLENISYINSLVNRPLSTTPTTKAQIEIYRKGTRFCTRFKFKLRDIVEESTHGKLMFRNIYQIDYIENLYDACVVDGALIGTPNNMRTLHEDMIVPIADWWILYEFYKTDFDLDKEIIGCIFGNALRVLYNKLKRLQSAYFVIDYTKSDSLDEMPDLYDDEGFRCV